MFTLKPQYAVRLRFGAGPQLPGILDVAKGSIMNKLLKGAIAGAAGVALLLGGAGTFALWNSSASVGGGTIVAGNLLVADSGAAGVWTHGATVITLSSFRAVPGDTLTYTKTMNITATGDNLVGSLSLAPGSITASTAAPADVALAGYLQKSATLTAAGVGVGVGVGIPAVYPITAGTTGVSQTVTVVITIVFPKDPVAGFAAEAATKLGSVNLSNVAVTLTQS